jgi:alkyl hydroperoxide reductase subunit AhpC
MNSQMNQSVLHTQRSAFRRYVLTLSTVLFLPCHVGWSQTTTAEESNEAKPSSVSLAERHNFPELEKECLAALKSQDECAAIARRLEESYDSKDIPEAISMLIAILLDDNMGAGGGWFKPAEMKRNWAWLAAKYQIDDFDSLTRSDFEGDEALFVRLDRNGDGRLEAADFNWTMNSPWMREASMMNGIFRMFDLDNNAKLSKDEMLAFLERISEGQEEAGIDGFRRAFPIGRSGAGGGPNSGYLRGDEPTKERLIRGFFSSEVGSHSEGPRLGEKAPDFELSTFDRKQKVKLSELVGTKPIVLIFGNYTCGPFRRMFPEFDVYNQRFKDKAHFFGIYVREAHPEDGWMMESNSSVGVKLRQPKTIDEREKVAQTCSTTLKYSFPLLVDTIDDRVGNLYSGMPARAYVIDKDGIVVYKGGRGPFGFIPGELEQALILQLLEAKTNP